MFGLKEMRSITVMLLAGVGTGFFLLFAAQLLPTKAIYEHVEGSMATFTSEGDYVWMIKGKDGSKLDNFTDAYFLQLSLLKGDKGPVDNALSAYALDPSDYHDSPTKTMEAWFDGEEVRLSARQIRFWNGYLIILKPLLMFADYSNIRQLNLFLQPIVIALVIGFMIKRGLEKYVIALFLAYAGMNPVTIAMNIFFSCIFYTTYIPVLFMLCFHEKIEDGPGYSVFFLILGMATVYFNMNSCLLMPLGMCLVLYVLMDGLRKPMKDTIKALAGYCISWGIGFIGFWSAKWILASLLTDHYSLSEAGSHILKRLSATDGRNACSRMDAVLYNIRIQLENRWWVLAMCAYTCFCVWKVLKKDGGDWRRWQKSRPFLAVLFMPFVWYMLMCNHSCIHDWFTYRTLSVAVFSYCSMLCYMTEPGRPERKSDE